MVSGYFDLARGKLMSIRSLPGDFPTFRRVGVQHGLIAV